MEKVSRRAAAYVMKRALLDASSAILLYKAGLLEVLTGVYHVFIPRSVQQELICNNRSGAATFAQHVTAGTIKVIDTDNAVPNSTALESGLNSLGRGERDTIRCLKAGKGDFIVTDDGRAARYCQDKALPFINALLFPRLLYFAGIMSPNERRTKMETIIRIGRYSPQITAWAFQSSKEVLAFAIPQEVGYENQISDTGHII